MEPKADLSRNFERPSSPSKNISTKSAIVHLLRANVLPTQHDVAHRLETAAIRMYRSKWWSTVIESVPTCAAIWYAGKRQPLYAPGDTATAHGEITCR